MPRLVIFSTLFLVPMASASEWESDLARAKQRAQKEKKPIFIVFRCEH